MERLRLWPAVRAAAPTIGGPLVPKVCQGGELTFGFSNEAGDTHDSNGWDADKQVQAATLGKRTLRSVI